MKKALLILAGVCFLVALPYVAVRGERTGTSPVPILADLPPAQDVFKLERTPFTGEIQILRETEEGKVYVGRHRRAQTLFIEDSRKGNQVKVHGSGRHQRHWVTFQSLEQTGGNTPIKASTVKGKVDGGRIVYAGVYPGVDEEYLTEEKQLKHNVILSSFDGSTAYTWSMEVSRRLRFFVKNEEKSQDFTTASPIELRDRKGDLVFTLAAPYAYEKENEKKRVDATYRVEMEETGLVRISIEVPSEWLANADYPVAIDPTIVHGWYAETWSNTQRKVIRSADGVLHLVFAGSADPMMEASWIWYTWSSDNGLTWSTPEAIGGLESANAWAPSITIDSDNHLHVAWENWWYDSGIEEWVSMVYYREFDGTTWSPRELVGPFYYTGVPCIVADKSSTSAVEEEKVHLVFSMTEEDGPVYYRSKPLGGVWGAISTISTYGREWEPSIALDSQNYPHVVWTQYMDPPLEGEIYYAYFDGSSWSTPEDISNHFDYDYSACIVLDSQDKVNVVWSGRPGFEEDQIWFTQNGSSWSTPVNISENYDEYGAWNPSIGVDSDDNLRVVWEGRPGSFSEIFYRRTTSPTWGPIQQLTDNNGRFGGMPTGKDSWGPILQEISGPEPFGGPYVVWVDGYGPPAYASELRIRYLGGSTAPLDAPTLLTPIGYARGCATFDWSDVLDPSDVYYILQVSTDSTFGMIDVVERNVLESQYTLSGAGSQILDDGMTYYWRARARSYSGSESPWATREMAIGDAVSPTTTVSLDTVPGLNGWYRSVHVDLIPDDGPGAGVDRTYRFLAERELLPADFEWIEIAHEPYLFSGCWAWNQTAANIPLGFTFPFYDSTYDTVNICSNGWLSFTYAGTDNNYTNQFPRSGMNNVVAPLWYQWAYCYDYANVHYKQTSCPNSFVVEWHNMPDNWWWDYSTFEAVLYPGGLVQFNYFNIATSFNGDPETGFNFGDGSIGYNHPSWPTSNMSLGNFGETALSFDLPEGDNVFLDGFFSTDIVGNREAPSAEMVFMIDGTAPTLTVTNPPMKDFNFNDTLLTVSGTANDPGSSGLDVVEVSTDQGASWDTAVGTTSWSYDWVLPGIDTTLTFWAMATDTAGNSTLDSVTVHLQLGMPISIITDPVDGDTMSSRTITVTGTATPADSQIIDTVLVIVNGIDTVETTGGTSWSATVNLPNLATDYQIQSFAVGIDTLIPDTLTETPSAGIWVTSPPYPSSVITSPEDGDMILSPLFTIEGTAAGVETTLAMVEVSTDGGTTWNDATGAESWTYMWSTDDGSHALVSRATNDLGAVQIDFDTVNVTVDLIAPTSIITDPVDGDTFTIDSTTIYTVLGTASDAGSGVNKVELSTDGGATWNDATGDTSWTFDWTLPESTATVNLISRATDNVGRVEATGAGITVYVIWTGVGVEEITAHRVPVRFTLSQNTPNPFARSTRVQYALPREASISLKVYNAAGRVVSVLADGREGAGFKFTDWDGRDSSGKELSNGIYFVRLVVDGNHYTDTRKVVLLR